MKVLGRGWVEFEGQYYVHAPAVRVVKPRHDDVRAKVSMVSILEFTTGEEVVVRGHPRVVLAGLIKTMKDDPEPKRSWWPWKRKNDEQADETRKIRGESGPNRSNQPPRRDAA